MKGLLPALWDRFLLYLPLALMALFALTSYWMVRSAPPPPQVALEQGPAHTPDYFMDDFSILNFDRNGRLHADLRGKTGRHYADILSTEVDAISIRSVDLQGRLTTATALRGLTNEDASEVQLIGNATVIREAQARGAPAASERFEYRSEFLHVFAKPELARSHMPVDIRHGTHQFSGNALEYDNVTQVLQLTGKVRATLMPGPEAR